MTPLNDTENYNLCVFALLLCVSVSFCSVFIRKTSFHFSSCPLLHYLNNEVWIAAFVEQKAAIHSTIFITTTRLFITRNHPPDNAPFSQLDNQSGVVWRSSLHWQTWKGFNTGFGSRLYHFPHLTFKLHNRYDTLLCCLTEVAHPT